MQLLAGEFVALKIVAKISGETVRKTLKNDIKPWREARDVIPPEANAEFVCQMEETLNVSQRPRDPTRPLVCFDEASKQLVDHVRVPIGSDSRTPDEDH